MQHYINHVRVYRQFYLVLFLSLFYFQPETSLAQVAPIANYHFDNGDFNDQSGNYHPTSVAGLTYTLDSKNFVSFDGNTGLVILPSELSTALVSQNSFQINFDIRFTAGQSLIILGANNANSSAFWQNTGFSLTAGVGTTATINFNYGSDLKYAASNISNLPLDVWHSVTLIVDLDKDAWKLQVNDQVTIGSLDFTQAEDVAFKNAVSNSTFTVGGYGGLKPNPYYAPMDLDEFQIYSPSPVSANDVIKAYHFLYEDLKGLNSLTEGQMQSYYTTIQQNLAVSSYDMVKDSLWAYTSTYEELNPPLFTPNYSTTSHILEKDMPLHDQVVLFTQSHLFDRLFKPANVDNLHGIKYEFGELFPGAVSNSAARSGGVVEVNGTYSIDIAAKYGMQEFVVRPTGYYLAAGDIVTIEVPAAYINQGLSVVVGVHFRNMIPGKINRPRDISLEYPITSTTTKVANPYGGGIYIKVPDGSNHGWFNVTVSNAIKSPYFSWRDGRKSDVTSWLNDIQNTDAPWADFESDKFMFTIPTHLAANTQTPHLVMQRWDSIMDAFRVAGGRPIDTRIRAEFYTVDRKLVTPAYGSGYPTVITLPEMDRPNSDWDPINVLSMTPSLILIHEMGHTAQHPTLEYPPVMPCDYEYEAESIVHVPTARMNEVVYKMNPDSALANSVRRNGLGFDQAAFDWIMTSNFRNNQPMGFDPQAPMPNKDMTNYQERGWAKYLDIARKFSWETLSQIFGKYYTPGVQQVSNATCTVDGLPNLVSRESFIQYASDVTGENMAPFFHFWGITPSATQAASLASLPKSQRVKELIDYYACKVAPQSLADYTVFHNAMTPMGYQQPRYDLYLSEFDQTYVDAINAQFDLIKTTYGLIGPNAPSALSATTSNLMVTLNWSDNSADESGFVIRYKQPGATEFTILTTVAANATDYTTGVLPSGDYEFMVTAINSESLESNHCEAIFATTNINRIPVITAANALTISKNASFEIQLSELTVSDPDNTYPNDFTLTILPGTDYSTDGQTATSATDFTGQLSVNVEVNDGKASSASFTVTVTVDDNVIPQISSYSGANTVQEEGSLPFSLTDFVVTDADNTYPSDFSLQVASGANYTVNGSSITPDLDFNGMLTVPVTVNDGVSQTDSEPYNVMVTVLPVNDIPVITAYSGQTNVAEEFHLTFLLSAFSVSDPDNTYPTDFTLSVLPGSNYTISGTTAIPIKDYNGSITVPVIVNDGSDNSDPINVTATVYAVNDKPIIDGYTGTTSIEEEGSLTFALGDFTITDPDNVYPTDFTFSVQSGSNYSVNGSSITADPEFNGTLIVPITINDGQVASEVFNVSIDVTAVNDTPAITAYSGVTSFEEDNSITLNLSDFTVSDVDNSFPNDFTLSVQSGTNYTVNGSTITPDADYNGTLTVPVTVNDGQASSTSFSLSFTVTPINDKPVISGYSGASSLPEDGSLALNLNDFVVSDPDNAFPDDFTMALGSGSNYSVNGLTILPANDFNGSLSIPITVSDGLESSDSFDLTLSVTPVNDKPLITAYSGPTSMLEGSSLTLDLSDFSVTDVDNTFPDEFTLIVNSGSDYSVSGTTITPSTSFTGVLSLEVVVNDGDLESDPFMISIDVLDVNEVPEITGQQPLSTNKNTSLTLNLSDLSVTDADNNYPDDFTMTVQSGANYTVTATTITPENNFVGMLTVPVTVNDGQSESDVFMLAVEVLETNQSPIITAQTELTTEINTAITIELTDLTVSDPDNSFPEDFTLSIQAGTNYSMSGTTITPVTDFVGTLAVPVTVNDGLAESNVFTLSIEVTQRPNEAPVIKGTNIEFTIDKNTSFTIELEDLDVTDPDNDYPSDFTLVIQDGNDYTVNGVEVSPSLDFTGSLSIPVMVNDGTSNSNVFLIPVAVVDVLSTQPLEGVAEVYPNPANEYFTISLENDYLGTLTISLMDMEGKVVQQPQLIKSERNFSHQLHVKMLARGLVFILIEYGEHQELKKMILE